MRLGRKENHCFDNTPLVRNDGEAPLRSSLAVWQLT